MIRLAWMAALLLVGCQPARSFDVILAHAEDQVLWRGSSTAPVLTVICPEGIGRAALVREPADRWPSTIHLELELKALEGFVVRAGDQHYRMAVSPQGDVLHEPEHQRVLHMNSFQAIKKGKKFSLSIQLGHLAEPARSVTVEWVDFYR